MYNTHKIIKKEMVPFSPTWVDIRALCQVKYVRQRKTDTYCLVYIWNMKKKSHKPKKVTHRKKR